MNADKYGAGLGMGIWRLNNPTEQEATSDHLVSITRSRKKREQPLVACLTAATQQWGAASFFCSGLTGTNSVPGTMLSVLEV